MREAAAKDPRDVPTYGLREAALYLRLPPSTVRAWVRGQAGSKPVIKPAQIDPIGLSFWNISEVFVLAGIRHHHRISLQKVRKALEYVRKERGLTRPLIQEQFLTDGMELFIERYWKLVEASSAGQLAFRETMAGSLRRIDRDPQGLSECIFPWINAVDEPRVVEINPRRAFGRLVLAGTNIPTAALSERFRAGEKIQNIARDFNLDIDRVEDALRWEQIAAAA